MQLYLPTPLKLLDKSHGGILAFEVCLSAFFCLKCRHCHLIIFLACLSSSICRHLTPWYQTPQV
ncbi:hypothetical protein SLEP1_g50555 [Rubroshorea leprosula]|uniref:Uncharacterized protein n=1 Tax=Rubroshorea leprosula TaxID=152421 RepID=A0AAV5M0I4_9ROSI|nr:hypothetical protein SLEP1_g50555 [Rubroshorea leprosula]